MRRFRGKIKSVSSGYPFTVEMKDGKTFISEFLFKDGMKIDLSFEGDIFSYPWPKGFIICFPNGLSQYQLTADQINAANDPDAVYNTHRLSPNLRLAVTSELPVRWSSVESFYKYQYIATFDPVTKILKTNYPRI